MGQIVECEDVGERRGEEKSGRMDASLKWDIP